MKKQNKIVKDNKAQDKIRKEFEKIKKQVDVFVSLLSGQAPFIGKPANKTKRVKNQDSRPTVRAVVREYIGQNGPTSANDLFYMAKKEFGGWSRHSLYRVLHDAREFQFAEGKYELVEEKPQEAAVA